MTAPGTITSDTIIAPASGLGGGVAVIRISGPQAGKIFKALAQTPLQAPRFAQLVTLRDPSTHNMLDRVIAIYVQTPSSCTGEDVRELYAHGGRAVVNRILNAALSVDTSVRLAEPGEFSKRAYLNGKMDLTEAEAIADLVAAETDAQAEQALLQMQGGLRDLYETWRYDLVRVLARMEAAIDFVDEEDVPPDVLSGVAAQIKTTMTAIDAHLSDGHIGERLRDGFTIAVIGAPNAGKSSLVNALTKRDIAIVSSTPGTTRDTLEAHLNVGGYPVILVDTAGLRDTADAIEIEGIKRAKSRGKAADIQLALFDATQGQDADTLRAVTPDTIQILTKADLVPLGQRNTQAVYVSATTGENMDRLVTVLTDRIKTLAAPKSSQPLLTRARHRETVEQTKAHLLRALNNPAPELMAEDMRLAVRALGKLTGRVDVEDLLDVIFKEFCIGK